MNLRPSDVVNARSLPNTAMSTIIVAVSICSRTSPLLASNTVMTSSLPFQFRSERLVT